MNPTALILSGVLHARAPRRGRRRRSGWKRAVAEVIAEGKDVTYDMKPHRDDPTAVGTSQFADAVIEEMNA